jgi:3-dehydroquinate synthetase
VALSDKKRSGGKITLIFPEEIGICNLHEVDVRELERIIGLGKSSAATGHPYPG